MITVYAKLICGCCTAEMQFFTEGHAHQAFLEPGHRDITDDKGVLHEDVDVFYGFSTEAEEIDNRGLPYLFDQVKDAL